MGTGDCTPCAGGIKQKTLQSVQRAVFCWLCVKVFREKAASILLKKRFSFVYMYCFADACGHRFLGCAGPS